MKSAVILLLTAVICKAQLYRVAGVVTNAQTAQPLRHAEVYIYRTGGSLARPDGKLVTAEDGRFNFDLPRGAYVLVAGTRTTPEKFGARSADSQLGSAVITGPDKDTSHLEFNWYPPASISGRIADNQGDPVESALVQLARSSVVNGRRMFTTVGFTRTNDLGEYRFGQLPSGSRYYVEVSAAPWYAARMAIAQPDAHPSTFTPLWYPNTPDASRAAPIAPLPGEEKHADFVLTPSAGATITVKHDAPPGATGAMLLLREGLGGDDAVQETQNLYVLNLPNNVKLPELPAQKFAGVPPGQYRIEVRAKSGTAELFGRTTVDVNGSDVTVEVGMRAGATVSGTISFPGNARPPGPLVAGLTE